MAANLMRNLTRYFTGVLLCAISVVVSAEETLPDPTRQPNELNALLPVSAVAASPNTGLQSIIFSHNHRAAIINGQLLKIGDTAGDATLVEIDEGSVVLQGTKGKQVLTLFPGVTIRKNESASPKSKKIAPVAKKKSTRKKTNPGKSVNYAVQPKKNEGEVK